MSENAEFGEFIVELGAALIQSSESVDDVEHRLMAIGAAMGVADLEVVALPTAIIVESSQSTGTRSRLRSIRGSGLRLDQVEAVDVLARRALAGEVTPRDGRLELRAITTRRHPHGRAVRALGLGVLSTGFSLALQPSVAGLVLAMVLGTAVGVVLSLELPGFAAITPTVLSFAVALVVFALADHYDGENPIRLLIPPLLIFLPGAKLTLGTIELAEGAIVSGASRLMSGVVELLLLAVPIVAAAALIDVPRRDLLDRPAPQLGAWTLVPALVLIAVGYRYHSGAPRRAVPWILLVMAVAMSAELAASQAVSPAVSAFVGAAAMTPVVLAIDRRPAGPRAMVLFLPGFYLLVPGATGLINATEQVAPVSSTGNLLNTMLMVVAIALGVLFAKGADTAIVGFRYARHPATGA